MSKPNRSLNPPSPAPIQWGRLIPAELFWVGRLAAILFSYAFEPVRLASPDALPHPAYFGLPLPRPAGLDKIQLWRGPALLAELRATTAPAHISAAVRRLDNQLTISWQVHSADGGAIPVSLRYSADAGLSWQTLALDLAGPAFDLDVAGLPVKTKDGGRPYLLFQMDNLQ